MAYQFMKANQSRYTIKEMTGVFGVSRSAYYRWVSEGVSVRREQADAELLSLIRQIVAKHHRRYGSLRVRAELRNTYGKRVSGKRVARLMRKNGLNARSRKGFVPTTDSNHRFEVCENILNRQFSAASGGQKWVSDITYLRTAGGWVYLTAVLDLYDQKVLGWALSAGMESAVTSVAALEMAVKNRRPENGLIFHSDRGVQYCADGFRQALRAMCSDVRQSMSRKGNC